MNSNYSSGFVTKFDGRIPRETKLVSDVDVSEFGFLVRAEIEDVRAVDNGWKGVYVDTTDGRVELVGVTPEGFDNYFGHEGLDSHELGVGVFVGYELNSDGEGVKYLLRRNGR